MDGKILLMGEPMGLFTAGETGELKNVSGFTASIAGAEYNVALGLTRLQHHVKYCTRLGPDPMGEKIREAMEANGISTDLVLQDSARLTGFMLKGKTLDGDPAIYYYRKNSAASAMTAQDVDGLDLSDCKWLHVTGIVPAISGTMLEAVKRLIARAQTLQLPISFDPNLRPSLWESKEKMVETLNMLAQSANLILPGLKEGEILTGETTPEGVAGHYHNRGVAQVIVKLGAEGAYCSQKNGTAGYVPAFPVAKIVDTVGAGDGFAAGVISALCEGKSLEDAAVRGTVIGSIQLTSTSDNDALPTPEILQKVMEKGTA